MPQFAYRARDAQGSLVEGVLDCPDRAVAIRQIVLEKRLKQPRVQLMTHTLHQALVDGRSFSQALSEPPRIFPPLYVNLVAAGEASGALPQILLRVVKSLMQAKELRDRVQAALI